MSICTITIIVMRTLLSLLLSRKKDSMSYVRYLYFVLYDYITKSDNAVRISLLDAYRCSTVESNTDSGKHGSLMLHRLNFGFDTNE